MTDSPDLENNHEDFPKFEKMENLEDPQPSEEEPCLPINNTGTLKVSNSQNSIDKQFFTQNQNELKGSKINMDALPNSRDINDVYIVNRKKKPLQFLKNTDFETKMCKRFGLNHQGYKLLVALVIVLVLLLLVIITMAIIWPRTSHSQSYPVCIKPSCLRASASIIPKMDTSKPVCEDFIGYACGSWLKQHSKPPPTRTQWSLQDEMDLKLAENIRGIIATLPHPTRVNSLPWKIKYFYESCMALDNIESDRERPLKKIINELGGWHVLREFSVLSWDLHRVLEQLHSKYGVTPFFSINVVPDPRNSTISILQISPSGLGLPDISYYYRPKDDRMAMSYRNYMKDVVQLLGATSTDAISFAEDMFYFERRIAEITPNTSELRNISQHSIVSLTDLKIKTPSIPIHEILNALLPTASIDDNTVVLVTSMQYLQRISTIIATTDRSALNNYFMWSFAKNYLHYLSQHFVENYNLYNRELTGASEPVERWEFCVRTLQKFMNFGLTALIEKTMPHKEENIRIVSDIFDNIRETAKTSVTRADWVDLELYRYINDKLNGMALQVGYPAPLLVDTYLEDYYSKLLVQKNDFFQNILYGISFIQAEQLRKYISPKEEYQWITQMATENEAVLTPTANKVIVPQRILTEPFYSRDHLPALLYGGIGVQIATAVVSSILPYNILYNARGNQISYNATPAHLSFKSIQHQLRCLIQFDVKYSISETESVARRASLDTFVRVSAVRQAFKALKKVKTEHVHQPGLESLEDDALFYLAHAQTLCLSQTTQQADKHNTTSLKLGNSQLLKTTLTNLKSFADAYGCSRNSDACPNML